MIQFSNKSVKQAIEKIQREYSYISGDLLNTAVSRALNRSTSTGRTLSNAQIRKKYALSASKINNEIRTTPSNKNSLEAKIIASGRPISLNYFGAKQELRSGTTSFNGRGVASSRLNRKARSNALKGVTATITKGKTINLPTAFIQVANGGITVFARGKHKGTSEGFEFMKPRMPIGSLTSLSIPMMFANKDVLNPVERAVSDVLEKRISHEIGWLLSK